MITKHNVICAKDTYPSELEVNVDTVYKRYNIQPYVNGEYEGWQYDEDQLTLNEYFKEIIPINQTLTERSLAELCLLFTSYQSQVDRTLGELSILIEGALNNV